MGPTMETDNLSNLIDRLSVSYERFDRRSTLSKEQILDDYRLAITLGYHIQREPNLLEAIESTVDNLDLIGWILELPFTLARRGLVSEAAALGARYAEVIEPENFLGDRAVILAEAGRHDEALTQVNEILTRFPEDPWISIKSGDAYKALGELEQAKTFYHRGLNLAGEDGYARDGALERLLPLLKEMGLEGEAEELIKAEDARRQATGKDRKSVVADSALKRPETIRSDEATVVRIGPKVGRNDPCFCGSGKKYKKCCLGKDAS